MLLLAVGSAAQDVIRGPTFEPPRNVVAPLLEEQRVFASGTEGYRSIRIPAVVVAPNGDVLAFAEGRVDAFNVDRGNKDVIMKRSRDRGRTWGGLEVVVDHRNFLSRFTGGRVAVGNVALIVDRDTRILWLHFVIDGSYEPGGADHNISLWVTHSVDDGDTWIDPVEMPPGVKPGEWDEWFHAPGQGIQLRNGRLLIPGYHSLRSPPADQPYPYSHVLASDDHGRTWHVGDSVAYDTNEARVVELTNGNVLINMRSVQYNERRISVSTDGSESWGPVQLDPQLTGAICHASLIRLTDDRRHDRNRLLFANPLSNQIDRENLSVKLSYDEAKTWTEGKTIFPGTSAYSDLVVFDDFTIGILYERELYSEMVFTRFNVEWLTDGADTIAKRKPIRSRRPKFSRPSVPR